MPVGSCQCAGGPFQPQGCVCAAHAAPPSNTSVWAAATLVHCGAGVSRSACLCIAYLMRAKRWTAQKALDHCRARRSLVMPNDGFWRCLCAFEEPLNIIGRRCPARSFMGQHQLN